MAIDPDSYVYLSWWELGLTLPDMRALGIDTQLSDSDLIHGLNTMDDTEIQRYARGCGLDDSGDRQTVFERILGMYDTTGNG